MESLSLPLPLPDSVAVHVANADATAEMLLIRQVQLHHLETRLLVWPALTVNARREILAVTNA